MIYGHKKQEVDKYGLIELSSLSFSLQPEELRSLARALDKAADAIDAGEFRTSHQHIDAFEPTWKQARDTTDIVILNPDPVVTPTVSGGEQTSGGNA